MISPRRLFAALAAVLLNRGSNSFAGIFARASAGPTANLVSSVWMRFSNRCTCASEVAKCFSTTCDQRSAIAEFVTDHRCHGNQRNSHRPSNKSLLTDATALPKAYCYFMYRKALQRSNLPPDPIARVERLAGDGRRSVRSQIEKYRRDLFRRRQSQRIFCRISFGAHRRYGLPLD